MAVTMKNKPTEESEDDKELQSELKLLVDRIIGDDQNLISSALNMLTHTIRTSTTSVTSVPKPLKYLAPYYRILKNKYKKMKSNKELKKQFADIISVLAMGPIGEDSGRQEFDCLKYCLQGTLDDIGQWGHEYIRQLENEIVNQSQIACNESKKLMLPLIKQITIFNCTHNAEIQACDLLMETDEMNLLYEHISQNSYSRICRYLGSCSKYVDDYEGLKILNIAYDLYAKFGDYSHALIIGLQLNDDGLVKKLFKNCTDRENLYQMSFICARHSYPLINPEDINDEVVQNIINNTNLCSYFINFARELHILDPKTPEEMYKTWLEPPTFQISLYDSARQNLASSFVNGFVNAGFGNDKLLTGDNGNKWVYRNKDVGMMSTIATLGLLYLWDVDGGLTPIDKYLYTSENNIKSGALLAIGIVNCRIKSDCDPALALLSDYVGCTTELLQIGGILGIGLAYAGTARRDVLNILLTVIQTAKSVKILAFASLSCGLVSLGRNSTEIAEAILLKMIESNGLEGLKSPFMILAGLGLGLCYYGCKDLIDVTLTAIEVFVEPFRTMLNVLLKMCAYACTGNVLIVQEFLRLIEEKVGSLRSQESVKRKKKVDWDYNMGQAIAVIGIATVCKGEEIGDEMVQRTFGNIARYGEPTVRKAVPLAIALNSVSNPSLSVIDVLTKYSHDSDDDMVCNAIFGLGIVGAGTNHARLAVILRQLASYHTKYPLKLFMVRFSQGLVHLGKGTMTLNPIHTDRQLVDPVGVAGLLIPLIALIQPQSLILSRYHYLLFTLVAAIQPRWLLTLDSDLNTVNVMVRVGQAVDIIGKAGAPKTISGIRTHQTPVLLCANERAELPSDDYKILAPTLDGICVLKKLPS